MKKNKTLLIIIICIAVVLIIAGIFAYLYFGTDLFKTNKELFAKYLTQMGDVEKPYITTELTNYNIKKTTTPYTNNGNIMANMEVLSNASNSDTQMIQNMINYGNQASITFNGKVDNANQLVEENITLNYTDSVNLPITYKQDGDKYGLQSESILPGYAIAVENNNLPGLLQTLGATNITGIPNKIEIQEYPSLTFSAEEKQHLITNYVMPLYENMGEDKFTGVKNEDGSATYTLTLTNEEIMNIVAQLLQKLSQDTLMIDKINSIIQELYGTSSISITSEDIQSIVDSMLDTTVADGYIGISLTQSKGVTTGILFEAADSSIQIDKVEANSNVVYTITAYSANGYVITYEMSYAGLNSNNVTENYVLTISVSDSINLEYSLTNAVTFGSDISISPLSSNTILINGYSSEEILPFLERLGTTIAEVNTNQMIQIGYPTDMINPILTWLLVPVYSASITNSSTISDDLNIQEMQTNNSTFEAYKGRASGSSARALCTLVKSYNEQNTTRRINVNIGVAASATTFLANVNNIDEIINSIDTSDTYDISLSYDTASGYVCEIGIISTTEPLENELTNMTVDGGGIDLNTIGSNNVTNDYNLNDIFSSITNTTTNETTSGGISVVENINGNFVETAD